MVGFGLMDNTILIRAGDAIDRNFGVSLQLSSIQAAACGQVFSDFCGVCFAGIVESMSRCLILPPEFTATQLTLRTTQLVGTAGAAVGVVIGCLLGMLNFLTMDVLEAERLKSLAELEGIFTVVIRSARETIGAEMGSVFLVDEEKSELWSRVATGCDSIIRVPIDSHSIVGWVAVENKELHIADAYADPRFNTKVDKDTGKKTENMVAIPVTSQANAQKVIAVIELLNKPGGFTEADMLTIRMLGIHASVFLSRCE
mmetsp:Transcript_81020/g.229381  ORF Transcript_81020/g.229381 Transcript_81020/m.229381 type:complete len:257 (-) Transcript_81020:20-790(-)